MFRNIKKASEYSLLSEGFIYKIKGMQSPKEMQAQKEAASKAAKTKRELQNLHSDVLYTLIDEEKEVMKLLVEGDAYKSGDWKKLNNMFYELMGVDGERAKRYLKMTQKNVFEELGLKGDTFAVADGKLGPYTLYAFALSFGLKLPKMAIPMGSPKLKAYIAKDADEAFKTYKEFRFAKNASRWEFRKVYRAIKENSSDFHTKPKTLGEWATALWNAGYEGEKAKIIGFPRIQKADKNENNKRAPNVKTLMKLAIVRDEGAPIYVDENGAMFMMNKRKQLVEPIITSGEGEGWENPYKVPPAKEVPKPKKQRAVPKPTPEPKPKNQPKPEAEIPISGYNRSGRIPPA